MTTKRIYNTKLVVLNLLLVLFISNFCIPAQCAETKLKGIRGSCLLFAYAWWCTRSVP